MHIVKLFSIFSSLLLGSGVFYFHKINIFLLLISLRVPRQFNFSWDSPSVMTLCTRVISHFHTQAETLFL